MNNNNNKLLTHIKVIERNDLLSVVLFIYCRIVVVCSSKKIDLKKEIVFYHFAYV